MPESFQNQRAAAIALINAAPLSAKEGGLLRQMAFSDTMTEKQGRWLGILLDRHSLSPLAEGEAA